ncbi:MAG: galactonate dehydratase [Armatimonadetes bacterium]|nr:galactonate dehydratase [Armatimonadota bacterium]
MKITAVETVCVAPRWVFLKISTDEGITGWGECLGDKAAAICGAVTELERYLVGEDPFRIEHHWQVMYRGGFWRGGPILNAAISGCEIAMWDILGQALGVPVYQLLGGKVRDKIRFYCHTGGDTPEALVESCHQAKERGFNAVKFGITRQFRSVEGAAAIKRAVGLAEAVRCEMGDEFDFMVDLHGRVSPAMAKILCDELAPLYPLFVEEPVLPENVPALADVVKSTRVPIATGERLFTKYGFREVLENHAAAVLQPDLCICGGILEGKKIAAMAEAYYVTTAPHCPYGPILTAASLQLDACIPNFLIQEQISLGEGIFEEPFRLMDGHVETPTKPGLGIKVDEAALKDRPYIPRDVPRWFHEDGSMADW